MKSLTLLLAAMLWSCAISLRAEIIINEIHYDPIAPGLNDEFIELHNSGDAAVDLSGGRLSGAATYTFPEGSAPIDPGGYLVVALEPSSPRFQGVDIVVGPWAGRLSSDGERVVLRGADDKVIDEVDFEVRFPWPIAPAGDGPSMELLNAALDNDLGSSWRPSLGEPTPGAANSVLTDNAPPNIRQVANDPSTPMSGEDTTISVKITDLDGVTNVVLHYLIVEAGDYIPAFTPYSVAALLADPSIERRMSAGYAEGLFTGSWPSEPMTSLDPEGAHEDTDNDAIYTVTLPAQANRTLVRYYITAEDGEGNEVRAPFKDDPSLNFAFFVYDGVPDYVASEDSSQGNGHVYSAELLQELPTYHLLTTNENWMQCLAYNSRDQHPRSAMSARSSYNWSGTIVYDGRVYDNISYRLRGGNGRYQLRGKRSMKFKFNRGNYFRAKNNRGEPYETTWRVLTTSKMLGNRLTGTFGIRNRPGNFGLVDTVNGQIWELFGVPAVRTHWFHFRVIDDAAEAPDQYGGDFYGLSLAQERIDVRFLESRGLPKGNLYKLTDQSENFVGVGSKGSSSDGLQQLRYQAPNAPQNAEDYTNLFSMLRPTRDDAWLRAHVNWDIWYRYTAVEEAIRHYDYWADADKNMVQYFAPSPNNELGQYWQLPYDSDASWGPSWNEGFDYAGNAIRRKDEFQVEFRNTLREFRDLVWQPDVIANLIDDATAVIDDFHPADWDRWRDAPTATGTTDTGTLASKVEDMKLFAFEGNLSYPGGNVGAGGRAAHLDDMMEDAAIAKTPTITFADNSSAAIDAVAVQSTAYKAASIFAPSELAKVEWRVAEVTDANAPSYNPEAVRMYEITSLWTNDGSTDLSVSVPTNLLKVGHAYRIRVRHWDTTNRVSHWSESLHFIAKEPTDGAALRDSLVLTELMYHPAPASDTEAESGFDESDFEFLEVWNRGNTSLELTDLRFTKGVDFDFIEGTSLAAGAYGLVVANRAAMVARYGADLPILGEWESNFSLSNRGERLKLAFGAGNAILEFLYDDADPWPVSADGEGFSLTLNDPTTVGADAYGEVGSWQPSAAVGGTPGAPEGERELTGFDIWLADRGLVDAEGDPDQDGITHFGAFAMGVDLLAEGVPSSKALPVYDGTTLRVRFRASGVTETLEFSKDLKAWEPEQITITDVQTNGDGTATLLYDLVPETPGYWRIRFSLSR